MMGVLSQPVLRAASWAFRGVVRARDLGYDAGLLGVTWVDRPVISIGNLTAGGTGKTPLAIYIARLLAARGRHVAVVSRGYGAQRRPIDGAPVVVSHRGRLHAPVEEAGDEPLLIAGRTRATVVVCPDRVQAARAAVALGAEVIVADDAFQHRRLGRDLNVLVADARAPFGNGLMLPAGPLREPMEAARRADLVVANHGAHVAESEPASAWAGALGGMPRLDVRVVATSIGAIDGRSGEPASALDGRRVAILAGIARPHRFEASVQALGAHIVHRAFFRDHAWLRPEQLERVDAAARSAGAELIVTTEKDAVRLPEALGVRLPMARLAVDLQVHDGEQRLHDALARVVGGEGAS